ncbi:chemotaxis protein CheW [Archangium violaceum]|uniref:Chemotaxis protein CheW n=1 Tax=Archangium violaceum Cb vi76 TaxID=1406225 RepID=A0A084SFP1_9BACT|nr:chemotaxis protein CheW [Archangium violaceum]KFA87276.1 chemotaxis protein CheW [Archangium violaceum Cb vi76]WPB78401.1 chemotaxis protein CheW [Archangium gephyra]
MRHVIFRVEKERYGLPLAAVKEVVVPPERFTRVPRAPAAVTGVMNLRGRVVTVVELRQLLGLPDGPTPSGRVVLLERGRRDLGLLVTDVDGIEAVERVSAAPGKAVPAVRGVARLKGVAVTVLDPEGLDSAVVGLFTAAQQK